MSKQFCDADTSALIDLLVQSIDIIFAITITRDLDVINDDNSLITF